jgi:hypothetical protein
VQRAHGFSSLERWPGPVTEPTDRATNWPYNTICQLG